MTETELQAKVEEWCGQLGLWTYHHPDPLRVRGNGWPDLVILGTRALFVELKSSDGELSADQGEVGWRLQRAGLDWQVWDPVGLADGTIRAELEEIAAWPISTPS